MESPGMGTENAKEHSTRPTRRSRNNNKLNTSPAVELNEVKEQENVNKSNGVPGDLDVSLKDEITTNGIAIESKVTQSTTANVNLSSSTPRRKKNPLANLHSNLSPKYIGFTTPNEKLNSSAEERTRLSLRRRQKYNNVNDTSLDRERDPETLSDDSSFTPSNESTVGFVRRTPRNKESEVTPDRSTKRKEFLSPIEKLLIKNGAVMEHNNNLLLNDHEAYVKRNIMQQENEDSISSSLEHNEETEKDQQDNIETDVKEIESCDVYDGDDDDDSEDIKDKDDEDEEEEEGSSMHYKEENLQSEEIKMEETNVHTIKPEDDENKNVSNSDADDVQENPDITLKPVNVETIGRVAKERKQSNIKSSDEDASSSKRVMPPNESTIESLANEEQGDKILNKLKTESIEIESNNDYAVVDATATANSPSAVSMDSAKGSSIVNETPWMSFSTGDLYWGQIYTYCYWPCMVCPDPNGKTITTDERTADQQILVHVRFFADNGRRNWVKRENLLPYNGVESYQERIEDIREKYGVKSTKYKLYVPPKKKESIWYEAVNEANIVADVPYPKRLEKFYEIFEKSKAFHKLEKQRRKSMYVSINSASLSDMESSYGSNDNIHFLTIPKLKRERSNSPYSPAYSPVKSVIAKKRKLSTGELEENATTSNNTTSNTKNNQDSNVPDNAELNSSQANTVASSSTTPNSLSDMDIFSGLEFRKFYAIMKDFVMEQNHNEKLEKSLVVAVRNIWALKQLSRHQMERKLLESLNGSDMTNVLDVMHTARPNGEGSVKRLSSRLKTLMVHKSLLIQQQTHESTPERSLTPKPVMVGKSRRPINRPILEVIDDIFQLDKKYLFKGMTREPVCKYCFKPGGNLRRCAKNCTYWLHADCIYKNFTQNGKAKRGPKPNHLKNTSNNNNNNNNNNTLSLNTTTKSTSVINLTEIDNLAHVAGDNEQDTTVVEVICKECANNEPAKCMVCNLVQSKKDNEDPLVKCCMAQCERAFHPACCKYWPQAKITISQNHIELFRCPSHVCHTCVSDDPKGKFQHISNAKLTKCVKCPATYHSDSTCIPAGSQIITAAHIICPRHTSTKHDMTVNVNWCFICVGGGQLVCCETCPTAVHAHCLKIPIAANEGYICEECESGRMPLYGEMVWAKFNNFRWWPAIILPPTEIPKNIERKPHNPSDFVVRFFGTHDHGWISRRRVYLYLEGDSSEPPKTKSGLDLSYNRGIEEAKQIHETIKLKKLQQHKANENKEKLHPQPYVRIKANRAVPPVKLHVDIESVSKCECDPREENPCGPDTNCLNRVLYHECNPKVCPAGERCQNQMFESRISPRLDVVYMKERGFGLVTREPINAGNFIIEYVGEVINDDEFQARLQQKSRDRDENFYFLSVEKDYIIDAGPKGNLARFMNHSCEPNCETQKWLVNSLNRVGLFAIKDIPENTELTFNYHWDDLLGNERKICYCGAKKCAGQIGAKFKDLESIKESSPSTTGKSKTKAKRLLNGTRKNKSKLGNKIKLNVKSRGRKAAIASTTVAALLKTNIEELPSTSTAANVKEENHETLEDSRHLESPDIFC